MCSTDVLLFESDDRDVSLDVNFDMGNDTVWLTQTQMAKLFAKDRVTITEHIQNIYTEEELLENSTCRNFRRVQIEGTRNVMRDISHYNLDVIISVGYRVKSKRGTQFRKWATRVLREQLIKGFALHSLTTAKHETRLTSLEEKMEEVAAFIKSTIESDGIELLGKP